MVRESFLVPVLGVTGPKRQLDVSVLQQDIFTVFFSLNKDEGGKKKSF